MKIESYFTPCTKINLKWFEDLNIRARIIKLSEENKEKASCYWIWQLFGGITAKAQATTKNR